MIISDLYIKAYLQNSKRHVKHFPGLRHGLPMLFAPEAAMVFFRLSKGDRETQVHRTVSWHG